jgi:hypothetical protein
LAYYPKLTRDITFTDHLSKITMASNQKKSAWEKTKAASNTWFQKIGAPVNKLSNKLGAEAFWPTSLDKEADKAARILRSFCIDGFYSEQGGGKEGKDKKHKSLDHIPPEVRITHHRSSSSFAD